MNEEWDENSNSMKYAMIAEDWKESLDRDSPEKNVSWKEMGTETLSFPGVWESKTDSEKPDSTSVSAAVEGQRPYKLLKVHFGTEIQVSQTH